MSTTLDIVPVASEPLVRQYATSLVGKAGKASESPVLLLRAQPVWDGPASITVSAADREARVLIRPCVSALAVRDAMLRRDDSDYLVVLTDRSDSDLGLGILSRCFDQRVVTPSMWEAVKEAFRARQVDSLLARMSWVAEPLMLHAPPGGWPVAPTGILTRDFALSHLTARLLGLQVGEIDPSGVMSWTLDRSATAAFIDQPPAVRTGIIEWVSEVIGPVAGLALRTTVQPHPIDAISIGLVADVLWSGTEPTIDVIGARVRLERFTGIGDLSAVVARSFADAARGAAQRMAAERDPAYPGLLTRATALFADVEHRRGAAASTLLPAGFEARLSALAAAIREYLRVGPAALPGVEQSFGELLRHVQAPGDPATSVARMAVRLARWLALPDDPAPTDLLQAVLRQARDDAFVDWAAADVWVGSTAPDIAVAWAEVFSAARARRDSHDRQFAALLAHATGRGVLPEGLVPVEHAIAHTLVPLVAAGNRLLVIIVDGMSTAVAAELADEAVALGWFEAVPEADGARTATLAALPTLTRYSRTSLLTGMLTQGGQSEERAGFKALTGGTVFHKADLVGAAGQALPNPLLEAIRSEAGMCAVVLNTVDDALAHADPGGTDWTIPRIQHLTALFAEATRARRTVVLISDHGHVIERGGASTPIAGAEARWRAPDTGPVDPLREVALTGSRVLASGGSIIAATDEGVRYATKQAGYHGGASAAEAVIPIIVLSRSPDDLRGAGWVPAAPQAPHWWNDQVTPAVTGRAAHSATASTPAAGPVSPSTSARPAGRPEAPGQGVLDIDIPASDTAMPETAPIPAASLELVAALLGSPLYAAQKARIQGRAMSDDVVGAVLAVLITQSGRAHRDTVAAAAGIPVMRWRGALSNLRRQLNLEGYDVLSVDVDEVTVLLDLPLLRQQFLEGIAR